MDFDDATTIIKQQEPKINFVACESNKNGSNVLYVVRKRDINNKCNNILLYPTIFNVNELFHMLLSFYFPTNGLKYFYFCAYFYTILFTFLYVLKFHTFFLFWVFILLLSQFPYQFIFCQYVKLISFCFQIIAIWDGFTYLMCSENYIVCIFGHSIFLNIISCLLQPKS